jgi:hypothetical protein
VVRSVRKVSKFELSCCCALAAFVPVVGVVEADVEGVVEVVAEVTSIVVS